MNQDNLLQKHNLSIYMYSFDEILDLFDLNYNISLEDIKKAKKKVLMLHPDKSKLSSEYFLFYKKAFDIVLNYYNNNNKQNQPVTKENSQYDVSNIHTQFNNNTNKKITSIINEIKPKEFQEKFNTLFEKNMAKKPNNEKNDWFQKEDPIYNIDSNITKSNMNMVMENIKKQNQGIIKYNGVNPLFSRGGTNFYDDVDDTEEDHNTYISSDPFSKLKFDDLRKVHKDQTVFSVGENDFKNMKTYNSMDQINRARGSQDLTPLQKDQSERILAEQQQHMQKLMTKKQFESQLKTNKYEEKNKSILSTFLQLT